MQGIPNSAPNVLRFGNYEPLMQLASGGMAVVHIARQLGAAGFERIVVVKRVHRHLLSDKGFYDMFLDEARVASMVRHPNVVPVIDVVEIGEAALDNRELLLVMEYVESASLATIQKIVHEDGGRIPVPIVARILCDALAGMHAAHMAVDMRGAPLGVVHRDVSPQNIIVGVDGSARLIDFGVAKAAHRLSETASGSVKGKFSYMAPEQAHGRPVDPRTDVFAAGIVFHEGLTAKRLFRGENELHTMQLISGAPIAPPSTLNPGVPAALDAVALKALMRDPAGRFQTALEMLDAIESAVTPASPREVSAYLDRIVGNRLQERREQLKAKLSKPNSGKTPLYDVDAPTQRDSKRPEAMLEATRREGSGSHTGTEGRIAVQTSYFPEPPRSRLPMIAVIIAVVLGIGAIAGGLTVLKARSASERDNHAASTVPVVLPPQATTTTTAIATATATATTDTKEVAGDTTPPTDRVDAGTAVAQTTASTAKPPTKPKVPGSGNVVPVPKKQSDLQGNPYGNQ